MAKSYKVSDKNLFVNPYNFVPVNFERKISKKEKKDGLEEMKLEKKEELLTGYFQCKIVCKTPLTIPDVANGQIIKSFGEDGNHYYYPYLKDSKDRPRIPGSSLRGVIRNVYETITDSCFITMDSDTLKKEIENPEKTKIDRMFRCNLSRSELCPACTLFGTAENEGHGSRIRFTDAVCNEYNDTMITEKVIFAELASPKISYYPFYLKGKDDNAIYPNGFDSDNVVIRGRKYYWHHVPIINNPDIEQTPRNATFDIINENTEFEFRIYFDGITESQYKCLATAIHLGENDINSKNCHKIGHGKPLGYGSVKMIISDSQRRFFSLKDGWSTRPTKISYRGIERKCGDDIWDALIEICNYNKYSAHEDVVEYPKIVADENVKKYLAKKKDQNAMAGHQWFNQNFKNKNNPPEQPFPEIGIERKLKHYKLELEGNETSGKNTICSNNKSYNKVKDKSNNNYNGKKAYKNEKKNKGEYKKNFDSSCTTSLGDIMSRIDEQDRKQKGKRKEH